MLPPRYLLREAAILSLLEGAPPGAFLEIGCGGGEFLVTLARRGWSGAGTDLSPNARAQSRSRLAEEGVSAVSVLDEVPSGERFRYVFSFEVLGYAEDPTRFLASCRESLEPGGKALISFVRPGAGYDSRVVQDMRVFAPGEVTAFARQAGLTPGRLVNYGFPLANALVPVMNTVHGIRLALANDGGRTAAETGLHHTSSVLAPLGLLSNRRTIRPFAWIQSQFAATTLGNGYLFEAERQ